MLQWLVDLLLPTNKKCMQVLLRAYYVSLHHVLIQAWSSVLYGVLISVALTIS
jgi:hypothetical protein